MYQLYIKLNLIVRACYYMAASYVFGLQGMKFDLFGRLLGLKYIITYSKFCSLFVNPISSVRYFEFDFVSNNLRLDADLKILDVSSPWLYGLWAVKHHEVEYFYLNPDKREYSEMQPFLDIERGKRKGSFMFSAQDATKLAYPDCIFDAVISISVIEHISGDNDSRAISEMWRVLKPGGRLLLTFPVMRCYEEEYRETNTYSLPGVKKKGDLYFFQRFYDEKAIAKRLVAHIEGSKLCAAELIGEIKMGFFKNYEKRWINNGLKETVKDPWLMARNMRRFEDINELTGLGVMGLSLQKSV